MTSSTVHLVLLDALADWEIGYLTAHLRGGEVGTDFDIRTVGATSDPVTTMGGLRLTPDLSVAELDPAASVMLVLPGAGLWTEPQTRPFVEAASDFLAAGTPVAAICGATFALAGAGLLDDRAHTSNDRDYLASSGYAGSAHYVDEFAVLDGDLITASGIAPVHFARAVFDRLEAYTPQRLASWFKLYADHDPAGFFELMADPRTDG